MKNNTFEFEIRDARPEDANILASAERKITEIPGRLASRPHELKDSAFQEKIAMLANSDTGKYVVIETNGKIVGHALLDPFKLEVTAHAVDKAWPQFIFGQYCDGSLGWPLIGIENTRFCSPL